VRHVEKQTDLLVLLLPIFQLTSLEQYMADLHVQYWSRISCDARALGAATLEHGGRVRRVQYSGYKEIPLSQSEAYRKLYGD
jgi:hypothetical protein